MKKFCAQALDRPRQILRHDHPADAPAGHEKYFEKLLTTMATIDDPTADTASPS